MIVRTLIPDVLPVPKILGVWIVLWDIKILVGVVLNNAQMRTVLNAHRKIIAVFAILAIIWTHIRNVFKCVWMDSLPYLMELAQDVVDTSKIVKTAKQLTNSKTLPFNVYNAAQAPILI